jgi:methionyl aminopeptidase
MIILKSENELNRMRHAGKIVYLTHQELRKHIYPGITTKEIDLIAEQFILKHDAYPSFKGYNGFPASVCTSVNEELVHGIPGNRVLKEGDIISIDIGVCYDGYHGDSAWTYPVGKISLEAQKLNQKQELEIFLLLFRYL